jgi:hypothetical protein
VSTYRAREIRSALKSKGFRQSNTDHEVYHLYIGNKKSTVRTYVSFGSKEYGDNLLGFMSRQLRLRRGELNELIECPLSEEQYVALLVERGEIALSN